MAIQRFTYYLYDSRQSDERRQDIERQGVKLSEEAWENLGRPFYQIGLDCTVDDEGFVVIHGVKED